jgi:hypothetical protein
MTGAPIHSCGDQSLPGGKLGRSQDSFNSGVEGQPEQHSVFLLQKKKKIEKEEEENSNTPTFHEGIIKFLN